MKVELQKVLYIKDGKFTKELSPDSDLCLLLNMRTRRANRHVVYNAHTKEVFLVKTSSWWKWTDLEIGEKINLDSESLQVFDTALAVFMSEEREAIHKPHKITISPAV